MDGQDGKKMLVTTIPLASIYIRPNDKPNRYIKYMMVLLLFMAVFIIIASENMLQLSSRINIYFINNKQKKYITGFEGSDSNFIFSSTNQSIIQNVLFNNNTYVAPRNDSSLKKPDETQCTPFRNLAFIKTHKTGSTTLASIMNRNAIHYHLSCLAYKADPLRGHIRFDKLSVASRSKFLPPLGVKMGDYGKYKNGYNMLTVHVRYQPKVLDYFMAEGTKYVTILREPSSHFESAFFFFGADKDLFRGGNKSANLAKFAEKPKTYWNRLTGLHRKVYTRNGQIYDLSFGQRVQTKTQVQSIIDEISKKFSLVLIMEYMDESLLLLKKMLCWKNHDISYVMKNQRVHSSSMPERTRKLLRRWNWADVMLYDHFNATLWRKIKEYGPTFDEDLAAFRDVLAKDYNNCVSKEVSRHKVVKTKPKKDTEYCTNLAGSQFRLYNKIYHRQMKN